MHLGLIVSALTIAVLWRLWPQSFRRASVSSSWLGDSWQQRWRATTSALLIPPLLLLTTALAIVGMGTRGTMFGATVSRSGYALSVAFLMVAAGWLLYLAVQGWRSRWQLRRYSVVKLAQTEAKLLPVPQHFAGQVGFWRPQLVVSQGLLTELSPDHVAAVLAHEQAHCHYHDTFWFFWLGWLRSLTAWLPNSDRLWQECLLLRELRADRWAAQRVDPLLLAEALLQVAKAPIVTPPPASTAFHDDAALTRFEERINALLSPALPGQEHPTYPLACVGITLILLPLLLIPLHH